MNCRICKTECFKEFSATLIKKYQVDYYFCPHCGYLQVDELSHLSEAYNNSITSSDVGLLARNNRYTEQLAPFFYFAGFRMGRFLDYGGGYGVFSRLMRDIGFDFYSYDPYTKNLFSQDFSNDLSGKFKAITALEVFEHLTEPLTTLTQLFEHTDTVILGTNLLESCPDKNYKNWSYLGLEHGQHIGFFSLKTMLFLANKLKLNCYTDKKYLTVLSKNKFSPMISVMLSLRHRYSLFLLEYTKCRMTSKISSDFDRIRYK